MFYPGRYSIVLRRKYAVFESKYDGRPIPACQGCTMYVHKIPLRRHGNTISVAVHRYGGLASSMVQTPDMSAAAYIVFPSLDFLRQQRDWSTPSFCKAKAHSIKLLRVFVIAFDRHKPKPSLQNLRTWPHDESRYPSKVGPMIDSHATHLHTLSRFPVALLWV